MKPFSRAVALSFMTVSLATTAGCEDDKQTTANKESETQTSGSAPKSTSTAEPGSVLAKGDFSGLGGHVVTGSVQIVKADDGVEILLSEDFSLDDGPGPWLGFGNGGNFDKSTEFSKLVNLKGKQKYKLPNNIDPGKYKEFYVWCKPFGVALGVAKLN